ncbi:MAG: SDR family NAD(P)-dependent oxidoreductase [Clostridiales bacterium]|nr:SDR family NAD(P)-dependent oxidoreductase [Clostridiales bacterium]
MRIALITGASSGLGSTFARRIDQTEKKIDEIWLVARRRERLEKVARQLSHPAKVISLDLTKAESIDELEAMLTERVRVGIFVNCAGFGKFGNYKRVTRCDSERMIDLNCKAAVDVTLAVLPHMRAGDRILEICSTAAFQPLSEMNVYAAGKAFLYSYTRALRTELRPRGIAVTAVCPWWISDTEFLSVARDNQANPHPDRSIRSFPFATRREDVVRRALRASRMDAAVSTPGMMCFFHRIFAKVIPRGALLWIWERVRRMG